MRVIFGVAKKLQIRAQVHPCTCTKNALCARAFFVFTSGRGLTLTSAHVMVRAPIDGQRLATHRHRAPHSDGVQRGCRGGAEEVQRKVQRRVHMGLHGVCVRGRGERRRERRSFEKAFKFLNCHAVSYSYITYGEKVNRTELMPERENPPNST